LPVLKKVGIIGGVGEVIPQVIKKEVRATPIAKKLALEHNIDIESLADGDKIIKEKDVLAVIDKGEKISFRKKAEIKNLGNRDLIYSSVTASISYNLLKKHLSGRMTVGKYTLTAEGNVPVLTLLIGL